MIPRRLVLTNFLSYRDGDLDFRGLHVACIAGPNGAGKSSLLEAIAWAIWGQSRVASEDDIIYQGEMETQVSFWFEQGGQGYRILRRRHRHHGSSLEFQLDTPTGYRVLTQGGLRATQQLICQHLRLDYTTFINSAYLRQGRADEFMAKRPGDRKQVLADLLQLYRYDRIADQAREQVRQIKATLSAHQPQLALWQRQQQQGDTLHHTHAELTAQLQAISQQQQTLQSQVQQYQQQQQQAHQLAQDIALQQQQLAHFQQLSQPLIAEQADLIAVQHRYQAILQRAAAIEQGQTELAALQQQVQSLGEQFGQYQALHHQHQRCQQDYQQQLQSLNRDLQQHQTQQQHHQAQLAELAPLLAQADAIATAWDQLQQARQRLKRLDGLQLQVAPLLQRQQQLQQRIAQRQTQLQTRLDELHTTQQRLIQQQGTHPQLVASATAVGQAIAHLEHRRHYQNQVQEKGMERRRFMEKLQANQRQAEAALAQIDQKLTLLGQPEATCPLCHQPLDHPRRHHLTQQQQDEQQALQEQIWVIREQLAVSEREIQVLRQEYLDVDAELTQYATVLRQRGHIEAQMVALSQNRTQLQALEQEQHQLQHRLHQGTYAPDQQRELIHIEQTLAQLNYDDRDHALARGQVDRLRWADMKRAELRQAQARQRRLLTAQPTLTTAIADLEQQIQDLAHSPLAQQIQSLEQQLQALNYDPDQHQHLRQRLQAAQHWQGQHQALVETRDRLPQVERRLAEITQQRQQQDQQQATITAQLAELRQRHQALAPGLDTPHALQQRQRDLSRQRDQVLAQLGAIQQQLAQQADLAEAIAAKQQDIQGWQQQQRVYQELATAFGRNGIPAMVIETLLPQLEAETNRLLNRLSDHQLHVQFVTQRISRQGKPVDTLDILIGDLRGTRPYETYSGGEAFRVNFAIRLALARLLAQRSGMPLQLLIIDEGFGTQDEQGCRRLVGAIDAIADDFACILAVTHIPHFREAFQTRIDVVKTETGSTLTLSA